MFQCHAWLQIIFLAKYSSNFKSSSTSMKFHYRIWCKLNHVLSVWWYIKFYMIDVFFVFFCCFTAGWSNSIHLLNVNFFNEETWNELGTYWPRDKVWDDEEYLHDVFTSKSFHICAKKQKINEWIELLQSLRPEQFNFPFFEHLGQKHKIGGRKKNKNKSKCDTLIRNVHTLQHLIHFKYYYWKYQ